MNHSGAITEETGTRVQFRIFAGIALFLVVAAAIYGIAAGERAGTTMLALGSAMAATLGAYFAFHMGNEVEATEEQRRAGEGRPAESEAYLPHASVWPFAVGVGAVIMANGLVLGGWALVPGAVLAAVSTFGYARQSYRRD